MKTTVLQAVLCIALLLSPCASRAQEIQQHKEDIDLLLVLAADVSRSINDEEFRLQRDGYAKALTDPDVLDVIRAGQFGKIAITFVEWSGFAQQKILIDWSAIGSTSSAQSFAAGLAELPRSFAGKTAISNGMSFSVKLLEDAPFTAQRWKIDVSGDGTNNDGSSVTGARDAALKKGVVINGLAIRNIAMEFNLDHTNPPGGLQKYYSDNVIGGPGSFVIGVEGFKSFAAAIRKKLIAEVASR